MNWLMNLINISFIISIVWLNQSRIERQWQHLHYYFNPQAHSQHPDFKSWPQGSKIILEISQNIPHSFYPAVVSANKVWNQVMSSQPLYPHSLSEIKMTQKPFSMEDKTNGIYFICHQWQYGEPGRQQLTQAVTHTYFKGNELVGADILINCQDFKFSMNPTEGYIHLPSLLTHEIGHVLGFGHDFKHIENIMNVNLNFAQIRLVPQLSDLIWVAKTGYPMPLNTFQQMQKMKLAQKKLPLKKNNMKTYSSEIEYVDSYMVEKKEKSI